MNVSVRSPLSEGVAMITVIERAVEAYARSKEG